MVARVISIEKIKLLRQQAHHLDPVVMIGNAGLTESVLKEINIALKTHELIKIKVLGDDRDERIEMLARICDTQNAATIQHIGKTLVVWRPNPPKPRPIEKEVRRDSKGRPMRSASAREVIVKLPPKDPSSPFAKMRVKRLSVLPHQRVTSGGLVKRQKVRQQKKESLTPDAAWEE
jgi:RNA-binding protein